MSAQLEFSADPAASILHFTQDHEIFGEGTDARAFFTVVAGTVRTCRFLSDGRRQIDAFHVAGDVFGIEDGTKHRLSAEAVSDCTVTSTRHSGLARLTAGDTQQFLSHAMRSMTRAQDHAQLLGLKSAIEKVVAFLLSCPRRCGADTIDIAMTRQDIADYLGLTIETVSRSLSQLERDGVIALPTPRQISFTDPAALRRLAI